MPDDSTAERYRLAKRAWTDADAVARLLEANKSIIFSQKVLGHVDAGTSVARAELLVRASPEWQDDVEKIVKARTHANLLRVEVEFIQMKYWEQNSEEATRRQEMRL